MWLRVAGTERQQAAAKLVRDDYLLERTVVKTKFSPVEEVVAL